MTFWQKLFNSDDVIYVINLFHVKIDKKKQENGDNPSQIHHWSVFNGKRGKFLKKFGNQPKMAAKMTS